MRKILAIGGVPGTGKTTLMRALMQSLGEWERVKPVKLVDCEYNKSHDLYVFGKYDEGEVFAGTDKLSMAVQPEALQFIKNNQDLNVIFEGDRLFNGSFLRDLMDLPDTDLKVVLLTCPNKELTERYKARGSEQPEKFLQGRKTKYDNLLMSFDIGSIIEERYNGDYESQDGTIAEIGKFFFK